MATIPAALPAINTLLKMGDGASPEAFKVVANVGDLTGPSVSATIVDVTSHSTGVPWRQKIPTLLDGGEINLPLFWIPASTDTSTEIGAATILDAFTTRGQGTAGTPINFLLIFPDTAVTTYAFSGYWTKLNFKEPVAGVIQADATITITNVVDFGT